MRISALLVVAVSTTVTIAHGSDNPTFDAVVAARKCSDENQQLVCEYRVGKSLRFAVVAIGMPDTAVTFFKSDWDGDYYATFGLMHGCVIVKPGAKSAATGLPRFAFVSSRNGKVYASWETCQRGY